MSQGPADELKEQGWVQASHLSTWKNRAAGPEVSRQLRTAPRLGRETRQGISGCRRVSDTFSETEQSSLGWNHLVIVRVQWVHMEMS